MVSMSIVGLAKLTKTILVKLADRLEGFGSLIFIGNSNIKSVGEFTQQFEFSSENYFLV